MVKTDRPWPKGGRPFGAKTKPPVVPDALKKLVRPALAYIKEVVEGREEKPNGTRLQQCWKVVLYELGGIKSVEKDSHEGNYEDFVKKRGKIATNGIGVPDDSDETPT